MRKGAAAQLPLVEALMREQTGLLAHHMRADERVRLITSAMQQAGYTDETAYTLFLRKDPARLLDLASQLSVGETYFFRDAAQLEVFTNVALPRIMLARSKDHVLTLWSAGCASGEEAYTLAMLLDERGLLERAEIVGTDISAVALARARGGRYGAWSLRATSKPMVQRYFRQVDGEYAISPSLMRRVRFERQGLTDAQAPLPGGFAAFDVIFCRNVLIYFTDQACLEASRRLSSALASGGTLFAGASDPFFDLPSWRREASFAGLTFTRPEPGRGAGQPAHRAVSPSAPTGEVAPRAERAERRRARAKRQPPAEPPSVARALELVREVGKREGNEQAVATCRRALEELPEALELYLWLAALLTELGRDDEAERTLRTVLYLDRGLVMAHLLWALLAKRRGEPAQAARAYRRVLGLCDEQPSESPVPFGEGLDHHALATHARAELALLIAAGRSA